MPQKKSVQDIKKFQNLAKIINELNSDITFSTSIVDVCYRYSGNELKKICANGAIGWEGPGVHTYPDLAHCLDIKIIDKTDVIDQLLQCEDLGFPKETTRTDEKSLFELTQGFSHTVRKMAPTIIGSKIVPKQIIKNQYYDIVLNSIRQINPDYTEKELIGEIRDDEGCLYFNTNVVDNIIEEHEVNLVKENNNSELIISLVLDNIKGNQEKVLNIIRYYNLITNRNNSVASNI